MTPLWAVSALVWAHWQVLLNASNAAWILSEMWIFIRDLRAAKGVRADRGSFAIIVIAIAASLTAAYWSIKVFPFARLPDGNIGAVRFASGIAAMWIGIALRVWSVVTLGAFFRTQVFVQDDHRLVTAGPYAHLRNPSYTGALMTFLGQGLITGNAVALLFCIVGPFLALSWRIRVEEQALRARFGNKYAQYAARSWALIPLVW